MTLFRLMEKVPVSKIPFQAEYERWLAALPPGAYDAIMAEFDRLIDLRLQQKNLDNQIHTAGWIPGSDWDNTVYSPIYYDACRSDSAEAAKCFGLFCYVAFMRRPEDWIVGKFELNGRAIGSNTYFMAR